MTVDAFADRLARVRQRFVSTLECKIDDVYKAIPKLSEDAPAAAAVDEVRMLRGVGFPHPIAVEEKAAMSVICLVFVGLCVRSFIAARRSAPPEVIG